MTQAQQPEALRLAGYLRKAVATQHPESNGIGKAANELERQRARIAELEAVLVKEAARTANEKLRADQLSKQHDHQAALNRDARNQLVQMHARVQELEAQQSVPHGWKLVPVEATPVMMLNQSGCQIHSHDDATCPMRANRMKVWKHMIAAAPTPPAA